MNILFLNGAGGTGKSSIITALQAMAQPQDGLWTCRSSTRNTYAQLGIPNETDSLSLDSETRIRLQLAIMDNEMLEIQSVVNTMRKAEKSPNDLLVVDRGPMDRMAYYLLTMMQCAPGPIHKFYGKIEEVSSFLDNLKAENIIHADFHYPVPWNTKDEFRQENQMQTMALSLMTSHILRRFGAAPKTNTVFWENHELRMGSPKARAMNLMVKYQLFLDRKAS